MSSWIKIIENVVKMADYRAEPETLTPIVRHGPYTVYPDKKSPDSERYLSLWVYITGPGADPENKLDIRNWALGSPPKEYLGLPEYDLDPEKAIGQFSKFTKRVDTLYQYGLEKPPEVRINPEFVQWRKEAILAMLRASGFRA